MNIELKTWDTEFFKRNIYSVNFFDYDFIDKNSFTDKFSNLFLFIDKEKEGLFEIVIDSQKMPFLSIIESNGFRLVDTKISFETEIQKSNPRNYSFSVPAGYSIKQYEKQYLNDLLQIGYDYLIGDKNLYSRYKSDYYSADECELYYSTWIKNSLADENTYCSIIVEENSNIAKGFFIYNKHKPRTYKGILVSISPELRGNNLHLGLQEYIFNGIQDDSFIVENATQLSNLPVIKNHFLSKREPKKIEFIYLLDKRIN
jgi:hypothetical protein